MTRSSSLSFWQCTSCSPLRATELPRRSSLLPQPEHSLNDGPDIHLRSALRAAHRCDWSDSGAMLSHLTKGCQDCHARGLGNIGVRTRTLSGLCTPMRQCGDPSAISELHRGLLIVSPSRFKNGKMQLSFGERYNTLGIRLRVQKRSSRLPVDDMHMSMRRKWKLRENRVASVHWIYRRKNPSEPIQFCPTTICPKRCEEETLRRSDTSVRRSIDWMVLNAVDPPGAILDPGEIIGSGTRQAKSR